MMHMPESIEELAENPAKYGVPTLEEFVRNREKYQGRYDDEIIAIDKGDQNLGCKQKYKVNGYSAESLEHAERLARDMGYNLFQDFIVDPQVRADSSVRGYYTEVNFRPKESIEKRRNW